MPTSPTAAMASSGSRAVWRTASAWLTCSCQVRSTSGPADPLVPSALLLSFAPARTRAMRSTSGRLDSGIIIPPKRSTRLLGFGFGRRHPGELPCGVNQLDGKHGNDRRVVLHPDFTERLETAKLERRGNGADRFGSLRQLQRRFLLALGANDPRAFLADRLGFLGDRALHLLGDVDVLDLDRINLDAPFDRSFAEQLLQSMIDRHPVLQHVVEIALPDGVTQ